jgi:orotidine-5'-phosphate decarboxylase
MTSLTPKIMIALDLDNIAQLDQLLTKLTPQDCILKIGKAMFVAKGPEFVRGLINKGFKIFLDLKFHDIPNQVANAVVEAAKLGVWMVNVHALGGKNMMLAAKQALDRYFAEKGSRPLLIAVTILTSQDGSDLQEIGLQGTVEENVLRLAKLAKYCGLEGVVCSAQEAHLIKLESNSGKDFITVTPGIRLETDNTQDQKRIMTPKAAVELGADYLVIGRPITGATDPLAVITAINQSITLSPIQTEA